MGRHFGHTGTFRTNLKGDILRLSSVTDFIYGPFAEQLILFPLSLSGGARM